MTTKNTGGSAVRLYVFIDKLDNESECPRMVIINRHKQVADLRREFADNHHYPYDDQYWVINNYCCDDETEISEAIAKADQFKLGYLSYLFIIEKNEKNKIPTFIETYLEEKCAKIHPEQRWRDPTAEPIIIADAIDSKKPLPLVGWYCVGCTFLNKPYYEWCEVCGCSCPKDYEIPNNFIWTQEDREKMKKLVEAKERQIKLEEERAEETKREQIEYRKKLEQMYKEPVAYTKEVTECPICVMDYEPGESILLHSCHHAVCKECLKQYLTSATDPKVKCPMENCVGIVEDGEISGILTPEEYSKYEQLNLRTAESKTDNTFHCKTVNCTAWVVFDDNVNFFPCPLCLQENCILCGAIHKDQTCKEYQDEMAIKARNDEAAKKDLAFLENLINTGQAMKCPRCKIMIQKKDGCDWMMCNMCKIEICWATKGPRWGPKGRGDTTGGCKCRVNNRKCCAACINCH